MEQEPRGIEIDLDAAPIEVPHPKHPGFVVFLRPLSDRRFLRALAPIFRQAAGLSAAMPADAAASAEAGEIPQGLDLVATLDRLEATEQTVRDALAGIVQGWRGLTDSHGEPVECRPDRIALLVDHPAFNFPEEVDVEDKDNPGQTIKVTRPHYFYNDILAAAAKRVTEIQSGKA